MSTAPNMLERPAAFTPDRPAVIAFLLALLERRVAPEARIWVEGKRRQIEESSSGTPLFVAFGACPRFIGKADLAPSTEERLQAAELRPGWNPARWSVDQAARTVMVLAAAADEAGFPERLETLFGAADIGELVALYQMLPLLPNSERFRHRAAEGVRSNMTSVFEAVALDNPYPAEQLDDPAWNQLVLKAVFVGSPLSRIEGLAQRANPTLARMLADFARERWAAGRPVVPDLWDLVVPFAEGEVLDTLALGLRHKDGAERDAVAGALARSPVPEHRALLEKGMER